MKKIYHILMGAGMLFSLNTFGQNEMDALRYSQTTFGGTARNNSMGGAFGALGGDFSTLAVNPGGIGVYRKSEISISPSLYGAVSKSTYLGESQKDDRYNMHFGNFGFVFTIPLNKDVTTPTWKGISFGFGYNRMNNFWNRNLIKGTNNYSSMIDAFAARSQGLYPSELNPFADSLAFYLVFLDTVPGNPKLYQNNFLGNRPKKQIKSVESEGAMGSYDLSFGGNFNDRIYLGMSVGLPKIRYEEFSTYKEEEIGDTIPYLRSFTFNEDLQTEGRGINVKFGIIAKPFDALRIGAAVHSPTAYSLTDVYSATMQAKYDSIQPFDAKSPIGSFSYTLTTPMKAIGSLAFVIAKKGIISGDFEFVDYSETRLRSGSEKFFSENDAIKNKYKQAANIRIGAEWRFPWFSLRGGYALYGNPYRSDVNNNGQRSNYTGGIGFRQDSYFIDFAYVYSLNKEGIYLYDPAFSEKVNRTNVSSTLIMTAGIRF